MSENPFDRWYAEIKNNLEDILDSRNLLSRDLTLKDDGTIYRIDPMKMSQEDHIRSLLNGIYIIEIGYKKYGNFSDGIIPSPNILIGIDTPAGIYRGSITPFGYEKRAIRLSDIIDDQIVDAPGDLILFQIKEFDFMNINRVVIGPLSM